MNWNTKPRLEVVDTSPGHGPDNPFSPPMEFRGDEKEFKALVLARYRRDHWLRQWLDLLARRHRLGRPYAVTGPWRNPMREIIEDLSHATPSRLGGKN
jgi:hypothetical protein